MKQVKLNLIDRSRTFIARILLIGDYITQEHITSSHVHLVDYKTRWVLSINLNHSNTSYKYRDFMQQQQLLITV